MGIIAVIATIAVPCFAGEVAVLKNGFSIRHERREVVGDVTRLYVNSDGSSFVDVPTAEIEHFESASDAPIPQTFVKHATAGSPFQSPFTSNVQNRPAIARPNAPNIDELINMASGRYRLDPDLVASVIKAESGFNVRAVSPKGAQGLMQLMPGTASQLGVPNAFDARANVEGGTKYLRELLERYNFDLVKALAAYNAGPERVEQFGGVPPFYETRAYVARVVKDFNKKKGAQEKAAPLSTSSVKNSRTQVSATRSQTSKSSGQANANAQLKAPARASE